MRIRFNIKGSIIYITILISSIVFASFYGGLLPFALLYGILLLIPVSVIYIILNYNFLSVYQELDAHRVVKGEQHELIISFENRSILPVHDMELILHSDRCDISGIKDSDHISLEPFRKKKLTAKLSCIYGGTYEIGLKSIGFTDAFGVFTVILGVPYSFRAIVSPKITDTANGYLDIENIMNSIGSKSELRTEEIAGNDMRDYYAGDALNLINWKVSARLSKLMVRVPDKLDTRKITLILEASKVSDHYQDIELLKRRDYFLEFAVSAGWYFAKGGVAVNIIYPAGKITEKQVGSYESFLEFYNDISGGLSYRSEDERERMHKLTEDRRRTGYGNETSVIVCEDAWPGEDFCIVAG